MTIPAQGADSTSDELVLHPPSPVGPVRPEQVAAVRVDDATAEQISTAVRTYVESLTSLEAQSPEFEHKVTAISRMGNDEIRRSSEASTDFWIGPPRAQGRAALTGL